MSDGRRCMLHSLLEAQSKAESRAPHTGAGRRHANSHDRNSERRDVCFSGDFSHNLRSHLPLHRQLDCLPSNETHEDGCEVAGIRPTDCGRTLYWLVAWLSGRTSVFGRRTFHVLCSTCS